MAFPAAHRASVRFRDRRDAGRRLAERLRELRLADPIVVALPRGGVPVAHEIAEALGAPLEVLAVRKLGAPVNPEYGIGAVAEDGTAVVDPRAAQAVGMTRRELEAVLEHESTELRRRTAAYRGDRPPPAVEGRTAIVVDDGVATGVTDTAALRALRRRGPRRLVLAVPVCSPDARRRLEEEADEVVCLAAPAGFRGVGQWYDDFSQVSDAEVVALLGGTGAAARGEDEPPSGDEPRREDVRIPAGAVELPGDLGVPASTSGLVLFAHGSGSGRRSPRNVQVARALEGRGLATLLFDLLTEEESRDRANVFDVGLLCRRLLAAIGWARSRPDLAALPLGCFGASTGAAAALCAAAEAPADVAAVVSRGGRPDLAGDRLPAVRAPTLLVVGGRDPQVLELNRAAQARLGGPSELVVVPGAGHLFEEPGTLEQVSRLAGDWFAAHLGGGGAGR